MLHTPFRSSSETILKFLRGDTCPQLETTNTVETEINFVPLTFINNFNHNIGEYSKCTVMDTHGISWRWQNLIGIKTREDPTVESYVACKYFPKHSKYYCRFWLNDSNEIEYFIIDENPENMQLLIELKAKHDQQKNKTKRFEMLEMLLCKDPVEFYYTVSRSIGQTLLEMSGSPKFYKQYRG